MLRHMLACEGCGQAKSDWDNARKARDFVVTSVRVADDALADAAGAPIDVDILEISSTAYFLTQQMIIFFLLSLSHHY